MGKKNVPDRLCKYYSDERWDDVFQRRTIRFTPPIEFNDPFDSLFVVNKSHSLSEFGIMIFRYIRDKIYSKKFNIFKEVYEDREYVKKGKVNYFALDLRCNYGVFCVTEADDNILMWSHYAESHTGFLLKNNSEFLLNYIVNKKNNYEKISFYPVKYTEDIPYITMYKYLFDSENIFLNKHPCWKYEHEWRMFLVTFIISDEWYKNEKGEIQTGIMQIPAEAITGVVFGAKMSTEEKYKKYNELIGNDEFRHITIEHAVLDEHKYKLNVIPYIQLD